MTTISRAYDVVKPDILRCMRISNLFLKESLHLIENPNEAYLSSVVILFKR